LTYSLKCLAVKSTTTHERIGRVGQRRQVVIPREMLETLNILKGKDHKGHYRKASGRYRIIFKPIHPANTVEVPAVLLRNEKTYQ